MNFLSNVFIAERIFLSASSLLPFGSAYKKFFPSSFCYAIVIIIILCLQNNNKFMREKRGNFCVLDEILVLPFSLLQRSLQKLKILINEAHLLQHVYTQQPRVMLLTPSKLF